MARGGRVLLLHAGLHGRRLYGIQVAHLDALQLVLLGTALEVAALVFEVPTGLVADTVSRRLSIIIGCLFIGAGFILLYLRTIRLHGRDVIGDGEGQEEEPAS